MRLAYDNVIWICHIDAIWQYYITTIWQCYMDCMCQLSYWCHMGQAIWYPYGIVTWKNPDSAPNFCLPGIWHGHMVTVIWIPYSNAIWYPYDSYHMTMSYARRTKVGCRIWILLCYNPMWIPYSLTHIPFIWARLYGIHMGLQHKRIQILHPTYVRLAYDMVIW